MIAPSEALVAKGLEAGPPWARISLTVHSDLAAVGLTAAFATALGGEGISANVVAGYFHDHIFVQWTRRDDAVAALQRAGGGGRRMNAAAFAGFRLGFALIMAIGAQNAFVLRQGLRREHVFACCLFCALSDAI